MKKTAQWIELNERQIDVLHVTWLPELASHERDIPGDGSHRMTVHLGANAYYAISYHTFKSASGETRTARYIRKADTREGIYACMEAYVRYLDKRAQEAKP